MNDQSDPHQDLRPASPKIEEVDLSSRLSRNPALWFGLILIPVFLAVLVSFLGQEKAEEGEAPPAPAQAPAEDLARQNVTRPAPPPGPGMGERSPRVEASPACDFAIWAGRPLNEEEVARQMEALGRPYRVLPPGSMMTMDYSPSRVNFDVDENGIVSRIWCG